jgi:zinc protease
LLRREFGEWPVIKRPLPDIPQPPLPDQPMGRIIKRDISQAYIFLGFPGPGLRAPDWNAARLMNYILGGSGLTSRISNSIREEQGLAYDASSYFYRFARGGLYIAGVQTKKEMANQAVQSLIKEIDRIKNDVTDNEVEWAKKYYIGHFPLTYDTYGELTTVAAQIQIENLGFDYFDRYENMINRLSLDQIRSAAQKYLHPGSFFLVIVGDIKPEEIKIDGIRWLD